MPHPWQRMEDAAVLAAWVARAAGVDLHAALSWRPSMTNAQAPAAPAHEHLQKQTLTVAVYVPDHPDRSESPIFAATRRKLIEHNPDARCYIDNEHCDHDHPLELHHLHVEWCDSTAVDWEKVKAEVPGFDWASFDPAHPETFIDSEWNACLVLCKRHHTGADHGVHMLPEPLWRLQRFKRADFVFSPDEQAAADAAVGALSQGA